MTKLKRIFISGPITLGDPMVNCHNAIIMMHKLMKLGLSPLTPHLSVLANIVEPQPYESWMTLDMDWVEVADAVICLGGDSRGSEREIAHAIYHNIPVFHNLDHLLLAVNGNSYLLKRDIPYKILRKFYDSFEVIKNDSCQIWPGYKHQFGYGRLNCRNGKSLSTWYFHNVSYLLFNGSIPFPLQVCHRCNVPACCNPRHLYLDTHAGNMDYMRTSGRSTSGSKNARAKLTELQAQEISNSILPLKDLAKMYGISEGAVSNIRTGVRWKHI